MNSPEVIAYRFPPGMTDEIVCTDPECLAKYADLMATVAIGMTQNDVQTLQDDREGESIYCASCSTPLDRWTATMGIRS